MLWLLNIYFPLSVPAGHGSYQYALCAPHGGLWGFLHRSAHPAANLRCLLEVRTHTHMRAHTNLLETCMCLYSHIPKHCSGCMCFPRSAKTPVKPNKEQMVQLQQGVVISYVLTHMADGKIKLMTLQCPKSCCSVHQSVINTYFTCPSSLPPSLLSALQIYPFRAIDHLGEFLPLHPGLQFIDPGGTISNA